MRRFSIYLSTAGGDYQQTKALTLLAEQLGYDVVWLMDNTAGWATAPNEIPLFDPWAVLPALAEATSRIKLGPLATPPGRRAPGVFAKTVATTDIISSGRIELTMGSGDEPQMYPRVGLPFLRTPERIKQMREELTIMKMLWTQDYATFEGEYHSIQDGICFPKPVQKPHPPLHIAIGWGKVVMPKVCAEFGDGFALGPHCGADGIAQEIMAITAERFAERGRDFAKIPKARCIGVIFANEDVDVAEYKKKLLLEAKSRTEIERVGQYWTDIAHKQWPQYFPKVWNYEKFYDLYDAFLCGSPAQVAQQIKERVFDLGFTEVQVWPNGLLRSPEKRSIENQGETIERFANEVIPLLK